MQETILVFGATGQQGGAVIEHLLDVQKETNTFDIRALVRNPTAEKSIELKAEGVDLVVGAMEDVSALKKALEGVTRVFFHTTHNTFKGEDWKAELARGMQVVRAFETCETLQQIIYSTLPSIEGYHESLGKVALEKEMRRLELPLTTVLSPFYLENFINIWPPIRRWFGCFGALQWGWLPTTENLRMPHGSVKDFGGVVARVLRLPTSDYLNRKVTIVAEDLLLEDILKSLATGIGAPIVWQPLSLPVFWQLPFPKEALSGLAFYAEKLADKKQVEEGFLMTTAVGPESLKEAEEETQSLYPSIQSIETWAKLNRQALTGRTLKKTVIAFLLFWAKMKSKIRQK